MIFNWIRYYTLGCKLLSTGVVVNKKYKNNVNLDNLLFFQVKVCCVSPFHKDNLSWMKELHISFVQERNFAPQICKIFRWRFL